MISSTLSPATTVRPAPRPVVRPTGRIEQLERVCASLWATELSVDTPERARLLRQLGDVERRLASMSLQLIVADSHRAQMEQMEEQLQRCERRIDELQSIWMHNELLAG